MAEIPAPIQQLPLFADRSILSCDLLPEGRTNHNYRVDCGDRAFFVRLSTPDPSGHGIDRQREYAAIETLYDAGLGPAPIHYDPTQQIIVTEFIEAPTWSVEQIHTPEALALFGRAIAMLHPLDDKGAVYNIAQIAREYIANLRDSPVVSSADLAFLEQVCAHVESLLDPNDFGLCHNDLWCGNCLAAKGVQFIDLEMAGRGDLYFDLVSFVHFHRLDHEETQLFLDAYADTSGFKPSTKKLNHMRTALHLRECLWGFTQTHNGFSDSFYSDCSASHLKTLRALGDI